MKKEINFLLIQYDILWNSKTENYKIIKNFIEQNPNFDIAALPEAFDTGFLLDKNLIDCKNESLNWMCEIAQKINKAICGPTFYFDNNKIYNRFFFVYPDGTYDFYDKRHLFTHSGENKIVEKGNKRTIIEFLGWRFILLTCYDLRFPVWSRNKEDYDVMIYSANWPTNRIEQWKSLLVARAIENQSYVVAVNRTGNDGNGFTYSGKSLVVNPKGDIIAEFDDKSQAQIVTLDYEYLLKLRTNFPVLKDRDNFLIVE